MELIIKKSEGDDYDDDYDYDTKQGSQRERSQYQQMYSLLPLFL